MRSNNAIFMVFAVVFCAGSLHLGIAGAEPAVNAVETARLNVAVNGLPNREGKVVICLWRDSDRGFPDCDKYQAFRKLIIDARQSTAAFDSIPSGTYAVSAFHDETGQGKLQRNFIGMPTSCFGSSTKNIDMDDPPSFKDSAFSLQDQLVVKVQIHCMYSE